LLSIILSRLAGAVPTLLLVSLITFALLHLIPGDPAVVMAGLSATPQEVAQLRTDLGLDQPFLTQLLHWYGGLLLHGNLGRSLLLGQDVLQAVLQRMPITLALSAYALVLTLLVGVVGGVLAALRQNTVVDQAAMMFSMLGISMPSFFFGPLLVLLFAVHFGWLPTGGYVNFTTDPWQWFRAATLPAVSLALLQIGLVARITRSTMLEVLRQDYVRTARAKGLSRRRVLIHHALRNALLPMITVAGLQLPTLLSGALVTETVFTWPGMGRLFLDSLGYRDYPMVMGLLMFTAVLVLLGNFLADLLYLVADPRIRIR